MNKFIVMFFVFLSTFVCERGEARILVGTNGNVVVDDLSLRMPTPEEVKAYENPGTVVPVYEWKSFKRTSFWYGATFKKSTNAVVFKDGKMQNVGGEYTREIRSGFLWYVLLGILAMVLKVIIVLVLSRMIIFSIRFSVIAFTVVTFIPVFVIFAAASVYACFAIVASVVAFIATVLAENKKRSSMVFWTVVFYTTMTMVVLWGLW